MEINKIYNMDCLELMEQMPKKSIDLVVTSPPYNIRNTVGGGIDTSPSGRWRNAELADGYDTFEDDMDHNEYVEWQRKCLWAAWDLLKDDGAIFYNHKWRVQNGLIQNRDDIIEGFDLRQIIIWKRKGGFNFNEGYFLPTYEVIYLITKPDFKLRKGGNAYTDVWDIRQTMNIKHPAPFPLELAKRCIDSTNAQIIFDPFMGSGTTAIAAKLLNRDFVGAEISKKYCELANKRLENYGNTLTEFFE